MKSEVEKALEIALKYHEGQKDKLGVPYILHPLRVGLSVVPLYGETAKILGFLHDVIEDAKYPGLAAEEIRTNLEDGEWILKRLLVLTKPDDMSYDTYIRRIKDDEFITKEVKLADIRDNSDEVRLSYLPKEVASKLRLKYANAMNILMGGG